MKTSLLHILAGISLCFFTLGASAAGSKRVKYDSLSCLQIEGIIANSEADQNPCIIELIGPKDMIDTLILKEGKKKFRFVLSKNSHYAIRISKKGYLSKIVSVNTDLLTEQPGVHVFEFETTLMREEVAQRLNKDMLDFPVAIIYFDYEHNCFSYNKEYSAYVKRELFRPVPATSSEKVIALAH